MKNISLFIIGLLFCTKAFSIPIDSVSSEKQKLKIYHVNHPVVGGIIVAGLFSDYFAIDRIKNKPLITDGEIQNLNTNYLSSFDRLALNQKNIKDHIIYSHISDYSQIPIILAPALLALNKTISKDWWDLLLMYAEGHTITFTFYNYSFLGPTFQNRYRPFTYYTDFALDQRESGNDRNSFYSGHTASTAYSSFFMAKVWCDYHPDFNFGQKLWIYSLASLPPIAMGYCRVKALAHFPSDCAVGMILGAAVGVAIPEWHKFHSQNISLGLITSPEEMGLNINWNMAYQRKQVRSNHSIAVL